MLGRWQLGVGYDRTNHGHEDTDGDYVVSNVYVEPRLLLGGVARPWTPYAARRAGRAMASYEGVLGITDKATGYIAGVGSRRAVASRRQRPGRRSGSLRSAVARLRHWRILRGGEGRPRERPCRPAVRHGSLGAFSWAHRGLPEIGTTEITENSIAEPRALSRDRSQRHPAACERWATQMIALRVLRDLGAQMSSVLRFFIAVPGIPR